MSEKKSEKEKRRHTRSRNTRVDKKTGTIAGMRKIVELSDGGYYVNIPREFMEKHNLKGGDPLPFAGNHVLKYVPVKEE